MFMDNMRIYVKGGTGGQGHVKYGGIGGRGGHVYVQGVENTTLSKILSENDSKRYVAKTGTRSRFES